MRTLGWRTALSLVAAALAIVLGSGSAEAARARDLDSARFGAQIDPVTAPGLCASLQSDGSTATAQFLSRGVMERNDGTLNAAVIDSHVDAVVDCGIEVGLRLSTGAGENESGLPADLGHYEDLVSQTVQLLDGRVDRFAVDNETAAPGHWPGTAEDYFALVRADAAAIHAANPDATVLDGTMASGSMTSVMVSDLYDQGRYDEAIALVQETQANELGGGPTVKDLGDLTTYVTSDKVRRNVHFFDLLVANQSSIDAMQLHYYGPWRGLPNMLDFVRSHGITIPIELWETNHRYKDGRPFVESEHADEVARLLITGAGEGSGWSVFSSFLGKAENDAVGLLGFDGATDHEARLTFRSVSGELTGATTATRLELPDPAWGYRFSRPSGDVVAVWSDPETTPVGDRLRIEATTAAVRTAGVDGTRHVRLDRFEAEGTPQFLEPDLVELAEIRGKGKRSHGGVRLRLSCPAASPAKACAGTLKLTRSRHGKPRPLGSERYRVSRGESERVKVVIDRHRGHRPAPAKATAVAGRCTVLGRGGCRSWLQLR